MLKRVDANVPALLTEGGCFACEATVETEYAPPMQVAFGADTFAVVETWARLAALDAQAKSHPGRAFRQSAGDILVAGKIQILSPTSSR